MREALVKRSSSSNRLQRGLPAPIHRPVLVRIHAHSITFQGKAELQRLASRTNYPVGWLSPSDTLKEKPRVKSVYGWRLRVGLRGP